MNDCPHPGGKHSAELRFDLTGQLLAVLVCDDCRNVLRPLPQQTAEARTQYRGQALPVTIRTGVAA